MSHNNTASSLHNQAASEHEAAACHHRKAAACHDNNKVGDAKENSERAMECVAIPQKSNQ
jgi:hypothetical protein